MFAHRPIQRGALVAVVAVTIVAAFAIAFTPRCRTLAAALLAFVVLVQELSFCTDDLAAMIAARLEAVLADQRTNTNLLALDGIERIEARRFDVEPGSGIAIE